MGASRPRRDGGRHAEDVIYRGWGPQVCRQNRQSGGRKDRDLCPVDDLDALR